MLLNASSKNLFKAAALTQEIESLEAQLQSLLNGSAAVGVGKEVSPPAPKTEDKISKTPAGKTTRRKKRVVMGLAQNDGDALPEEKAPAAVSELEEVTARRQRNSGKAAESAVVKRVEPRQGVLRKRSEKFYPIQSSRSMFRVSMVGWLPRGMSFLFHDQERA